MAGNLIRIFPKEQRAFWENVCRNEKWLQEIRLRVDKPVIVQCRGKEFFVDEQGAFTKEVFRAHLTSREEIKALLSHLCQDSLYAFEEEIRQGFLTVQGGHRVGLIGQVVMEESKEGPIRTIKHITSMNIRIAHQIKGVADDVLPLLYQRGRFLNTLIISPPGCGKTTLLRDLVRQLSDGTVYGAGMRVGIVDERSEIAACFLGQAQNDVGIRTDVLDACPKKLGMMLLIRSMSPQIIAVDELGGQEDIEALHMAACSGIGMLATVHGKDFADYHHKFGRWEQRGGVLFERFVLLGKKNGIPILQKVLKREDLYDTNVGCGDDFQWMPWSGTVMPGTVTG